MSSCKEISTCKICQNEVIIFNDNNAISHLVKECCECHQIFCCPTNNDNINTCFNCSCKKQNNRVYSTSPLSFKDCFECHDSFIYPTDYDDLNICPKCSHKKYKKPDNVVYSAITCVSCSQIVCNNKICGAKCCEKFICIKCHSFKKCNDCLNVFCADSKTNINECVLCGNNVCDKCNYKCEFCDCIIFCCKCKSDENVNPRNNACYVFCGDGGQER